MCGRYNIIDDELTRRLLREIGVSGHLATQYNIAPTESVPAIIRANGKNELHLMQWWFTPHWADQPSTRYSMFNARSDHVEKSPAFRGSFRHKRAVMPASSFIEWRAENGKKQPYCISAHNSALAMAALWDCWEKDSSYLLSCAIITREAEGSMRDIHQRMPVLLNAEQSLRWLDTETPVNEVRELMNGEPTHLCAIPLDTRVNNSRNKDDRAVTANGDALDLPAA